MSLVARSMPIKWILFNDKFLGPVPSIDFFLTFYSKSFKSLYSQKIPKPKKTIIKKKLHYFCLQFKNKKPMKNAPKSKQSVFSSVFGDNIIYFSIIQVFHVNSHASQLISRDQFFCPLSLLHVLFRNHCSRLTICRRKRPIRMQKNNFTRIFWEG